MSDLRLFVVKDGEGQVLRGGSCPASEVAHQAREGETVEIVDALPDPAPVPPFAP